MQSITLSTGRKILSDGLIGINLDGAPTLLFGWDDYEAPENEDTEGPRLTDGERAEIASLMVVRWQLFGQVNLVAAEREACAIVVTKTADEQGRLETLRETSSDLRQIYNHTRRILLQTAAKIRAMDAS